MIGKDYCRCPGCGQCDAAEEVERLREVLVRIGNEARDLKTVKANGSRRPRTRRGWVMTRAELIAMLERAEGPSAELDIAVWEEITGDRQRPAKFRPVPKHTSRVIDAEIAIPGGMRWGITARNRDFEARVGESSKAHHREAAIALCIAALKARGETS